MESGKVDRKKLDDCGREGTGAGWQHGTQQGGQWSDPADGLWSVPDMSQALTHILLPLQPRAL